MVQYNIGSVWALNSLLLQRVWSHSQCSSSFVYLITPYTNWHSPKTRSAITHVMTFFSCPTLIWLGNIIIIIIIIIVIRWKILSGEGLRRHERVRVKAQEFTECLFVCVCVIGVAKWIWSRFGGEFLSNIFIFIYIDIHISCYTLIFSIRFLSSWWINKWIYLNACDDSDI